MIELIIGSHFTTFAFTEMEDVPFPFLRIHFIVIKHFTLTHKIKKCFRKYLCSFKYIYVGMYMVMDALMFMKMTVKIRRCLSSNV